MVNTLAKLLSHSSMKIQACLHKQKGHICKSCKIEIENIDYEHDFKKFAWLLIPVVLILVVSQGKPDSLTSGPCCFSLLITE